MVHATQEEMVNYYVKLLREMAKDYDEIGPSDLIDVLELNRNMRSLVLDALIS